MKVRFTALSISSIDMKMVMMLRRKRNPATPSANSTALRIRYQEIGTPVILLIHLLQGQNDRADDRDQNQNRRHFEREKIAREQRLAHVLCCATGERAEVHGPRVGIETK